MKDMSGNTDLVNQNSVHGNGEVEQYLLLYLPFTQFSDNYFKTFTIYFSLLTLLLSLKNEYLNYKSGFSRSTLGTVLYFKSLIKKVKNNF